MVKWICRLQSVLVLSVTKKVYVQAGAGLVADSNPESEWNETQIKARAVIKAVELSSNGLIL